MVTESSYQLLMFLLKCRNPKRETRSTSTGHSPSRKSSALGGGSGYHGASDWKLLPPAFDKDISITPVPPSWRDPYDVLARRKVPSSRLPGIRIPVPAMVAADPDMPPARSDGAVLMDANRGSQLHHDLRVSGYYPKGKAKKRGKNQFSHLLLLLLYQASGWPFERFHYFNNRKGPTT